MQDRARGREANRAGSKALFNNGRHPRNLSFCRFLICRTAVTHHIGTHCAMGDLGGYVDGTIQSL